MSITHIWIYIIYKYSNINPYPILIWNFQQADILTLSPRQQASMVYCDSLSGNVFCVSSLGPGGCSHHATWSSCPATSTLSVALSFHLGSQARDPECAAAWSRHPAACLSTLRTPRPLPLLYPRHPWHQWGLQACVFTHSVRLTPTPKALVGLPALWQWVSSSILCAPWPFWLPEKRLFRPSLHGAHTRQQVKNGEAVGALCLIPQALTTASQFLPPATCELESVSMRVWGGLWTWVHTHGLPSAT